MLWLPSSKNRVIFTVSDDTDTEDFVSFDMEVARLTNIQASKAARIVCLRNDSCTILLTGLQGIGVDAQVDIELHRSLAEIVGNTYAFQLKLKDFNFTLKHQTFTISRIFPAKVHRSSKQCSLKLWHKVQIQS
ncbi:unnamed protein product [Brassica oleracea var. botrytis]|uniref:Uncharacterized protein n=1 Tax=Brassica oleracea TaxID=3712 RepID=A0A3P6E4J4_BRAOL|nr:unnamed protein product [Brassica oleracea]